MRDKTKSSNPNDVSQVEPLESSIVRDVQENRILPDKLGGQTDLLSVNRLFILPIRTCCFRPRFTGRLCLKMQSDDLSNGCLPFRGYSKLPRKVRRRGARSFQYLGLSHNFYSISPETATSAAKIGWPELCERPRKAHAEDQDHAWKL